MVDIPETEISIKEAAEFTGLSEDTIRYYEKIGLLPYADRKANGHRRYSKHQLEGMVILTKLKTTGMTLHEMKRFRNLYEGGVATISQRVSILFEHKEKIQKEIDRLLETQRFLDYKIAHYHEFLLNPEINNTARDPVEY